MSLSANLVLQLNHSLGGKWQCLLFMLCNTRPFAWLITFCANNMVTQTHLAAVSLSLNWGLPCLLHNSTEISTFITCQCHWHKFEISQSVMHSRCFTPPLLYLDLTLVWRRVAQAYPAFSLLSQCWVKNKTIYGPEGGQEWLIYIFSWFIYVFFPFMWYFTFTRNRTS